MTAKGKITATALNIGDRIIVKSGTYTADEAAAWGSSIQEGGSYFHESRTKTGEGVSVVRVLDKTFRAASGPYERQGKYVITTTGGTFEAAGVQTMWLAPEDAAGVKRAHVEALAENEARELLEEEATNGHTAEELAEDTEAVDFAQRDQLTAWAIGHGSTYGMAVTRAGVAPWLITLDHGAALAIAEEQERSASLGEYLADYEAKAARVATAHERQTTVVVHGPESPLAGIVQDNAWRRFHGISAEDAGDPAWTALAIDSDWDEALAEDAPAEVRRLRARAAVTTIPEERERIQGKLAALGTVIHPEGTREYREYRTKLRAALAEWASSGQ